MSAARNSVTEAVEADAATGEVRGQSPRCAQRSVRDDELPQPACQESSRRAFCGPSCTDQDRTAVVEVLEALPGEIDCDRGNRGRSRSHAGLAPNPLAGRERLPVDPGEQGPQQPFLRGAISGGADLALDLALADDHRIEARGDPEQMRDGVVLVERVESALQSSLIEPRLLEQSAPERGLPDAGVLDDGVELRPVAG